VTRKAFWKSKGFWGGLGSILTGLSIIFTTGHVSSDAILAIGTGGLAVYGRVVADTPLSLSDRVRILPDVLRPAMRPRRRPDPR